MVVPKDYDLGLETPNLLQQHSAAGGFVLKRDDFDDSQLIPALGGSGSTSGWERSGGPLTDGPPREWLIPLHMLNYRYDRGASGFSDLTGVEVTLTVPEGLTLEGRVLKVLSPEGGSTALDFEVRGGRSRSPSPASTVTPSQRSSEKRPDTPGQLNSHLTFSPSSTLLTLPPSSRYLRWARVSPVANHL